MFGPVADGVCEEGVGGMNALSPYSTIFTVFGGRGMNALSPYSCHRIRIPSFSMLAVVNCHLMGLENAKGQYY